MKEMGSKRTLCNELWEEEEEEEDGVLCASCSLTWRGPLGPRMQ